MVPSSFFAPYYLGMDTMTMVIRFGSDIWEVTMLERKCSNLKPGDFLLDFAPDQESLMRVETVQIACDFFLHPIVMIIGRTANGRIHSHREGLNEKTFIYRPKRLVHSLQGTTESKVAS
jgi:hypothetical protein